MGKSRSSTVLIAYLLWSSRQPTPPSQNTSNDPDMVSLPPKPLSVIDALTLLRQGRPIAEPNEGFMDQLYLYVDMGCPSTQVELESHKLYRRWMNKRNVAESLRINQAPDMVDIKFEDEDDSTASPEDSQPTSTDKMLANLSLSDSSANQETIAPGISAPTGTEPPSQHPNANSLAFATNQPQSDLLVKCRRCRHLLARSNFILPHSPLQSDPSFTSQSQQPHTSSPPTQYPQDETSPHASDPSLSTNEPKLAAQCAHIFLHPLSWMKPALQSGALDGKLLCPNRKCGQNIGKFAWQGLRCSCGGWVTPGFGVMRSKVDEITIDLGKGDKVRGEGPKGLGESGGGTLRLPPGMRRGGNL